MELTDTVRVPSTVTLNRYGTDERTIQGDTKVKLQFTGPGSELVLNEGPPAGKQWRVFIQVYVDESDI